jgi:hypothetical protein
MLSAKHHFSLLSTAQNPAIDLVPRLTNTAEIHVPDFRAWTSFPKNEN